MTPHNRAKKDEVAKIVLMPGDPLRAQWIAQTFLDNFKLINDVRGMLGFTGNYQNKKVTVMGHGMGIPSIGIYSYELFYFYEVDAIIRIGSAGSYDKNINVGDLLLATSAYSESHFATTIGVKVNNNVLYGDKQLNQFILDTANHNKIKIKQIQAYSSDVFYGNVLSIQEIVNKTKSQVVEMEAFALFANAIKLNKKAATLLTCSDSLVTHKAMSAQERQTKFKDMVTLALKVAISF